MTLDQLRMLTKVAEEGSIFAAAEALYRTQPTVSMGLRKLEKELGVQLLARDQYRAALTAEGMILYEKAKTILEQVETFEQLAQYLAEGHEAEMRIAIEFSCPGPLMLEIMRICNEDFPQTQFSFSVENILGGLDKLTSGEADLAITPLMNSTAPVESFVLTHVEILRVAAPTFPLCHVQTGKGIEQLKKYVQVLVQDSSRVRPDRHYNALDGGRRWYVNDHYTKKELIMAGMGWGGLHRHMIEDELADGRLEPLEIENYPLSNMIKLSVVRKAGQVQGPVAAALWESLQGLVDQ